MNTPVDPRQAMKEALRESYLHRNAEGRVCALCGAQRRLLAFHLLERSITEGEPQPKGFVPVAISMGYVKGAFPICDKCAPRCSTCRLPIDTPKVHAYGRAVQARLGVGYCQEHIHFKNLVSALFNKIFK